MAGKVNRDNALNRLTYLLSLVRSSIHSASASVRFAKKRAPGEGARFTTH
jgi:hypothetical protein